jgi:hypothetical protein
VRSAFSLGMLVLLASLCGCPPGLDVEAAEGKRCDDDRDCNRLPDGGVAECGRLRVCVRGHCEADAGSRLVACEP